MPADSVRPKVLKMRPKVVVARQLLLGCAKFPGDRPAKASAELVQVELRLVAARDLILRVEEVAGIHRIVTKERVRRAMERIGARLGDRIDDRARSPAELRGVVGRETVQVSAEAPIVNTANAEISQTVDSRRVNELPLNGRDFTRSGGSQTLAVRAGGTMGRLRRPASGT